MHYSEGGFVKQKCTKCEKKPTTISEQEFRDLHLWVACPECKQQMKPKKIVHDNYGYECQKCQFYIKLASLLPFPTDII